jgi:hypothetical protein
MPPDTASNSTGHDYFLQQLAAKWADYQRVLEASRRDLSLHAEVQRLYEEAIAFSMWAPKPASLYDELQAELPVNPDRAASPFKV